MTTSDARTPERATTGDTSFGVHPLIDDAGSNGMSRATGKPDHSPEDLQERDRHLMAVIDQLDLKPIQIAYLRERWLGQLHYLGESARRAQRRYYGLRLVAILGGVLVPALIGLYVGGSGDPAVRWLAFVLGLLVAAAVALEEFFRFGERWRHFRQQSELQRGEGWAFIELASPVYRRYTTHAEAFRTFVTRTEEAMRQEIGVYIADVVRAAEDVRAPTPDADPSTSLLTAPTARKTDPRTSSSRT